MKFFCSKEFEADQQWNLFWQYSLQENWSVHSSDKINQRTKGILVLTPNDSFDDEFFKYKNLWILADELDARFFSSQERDLQVFKIAPESREEWDEFTALMQAEEIRDLIESKHKKTLQFFSDFKDNKKIDQALLDVFSFNLKLKDIDFNADEEEIIDDLQKIKKTIKLFSDIEFLLEEDVLSLSEENFVWNIPDSKLLLVFNSEKHETFIAVVLISYLLESIFKFSRGFTTIQSEVPILFQHALHITDPIALMTDKGDLLYYNDSFSKLSYLPSDCLNLQSDQIVEINHQFYRFKRFRHLLGDLVTYYVFFMPDQNEQVTGLDDKKAPEELGIISSSLAHELNNPIAGIIAATSVLELEEWDEDSRLSIKDIKEGAIRCKQLIEIFLGFSRLSPHLGKVQNTGEIEKAFDQALQLLRFRMMEREFRMELKKTPSLEIFQSPINSSVLSMIIYLILSETLTAFEHSKLVVSGGEGNNLNVFVTEFSQQISMQFDKTFDFKERIQASKLIQHLLGHEKLAMHIGNKEIKLIAL